MEERDFINSSNIDEGQFSREYLEMLQRAREGKGVPKGFLYVDGEIIRDPKYALSKTGA